MTIPPDARRSLRARSCLIASTGIWLAAVGVGLWLLADYATSPGIAAAAPDQWPAQSRIVRNRDHETLIMFAHPHCPCTRASIEELSRLMAQTQGAPVDAYVLFLAPSSADDGWEQTDLWRSAETVPGVRVMADEDGREANAFGSVTSGQTLLYDRAGRLLFSGGVTAARGHGGDNAGRDAVVSWLTKPSADAAGAPVFGCPLFEVAAANSGAENGPGRP